MQNKILKKILITGGAGNIGCALASQLLQDSKNLVVVVDNLSTGSLQKVPQGDKITFIKCDVNVYRDIAPVFARFDFDYVFHFAAVVGVQRTLDNPIAVLDDIDGIKNILSLSKNSGVQRVFYSSSSEVYGEPFEIPQNEHTTPLNSRLPYAIVKNLGEAYFKSYQQEYGLEYTIFRFFNTYGPSQSTDFVVPKFIKLAKNNEPITIYGDGKQTRTFCYIDDNIDTMLAILGKNICLNEVINIGSHKEITIIELAQTIISVLGSSSEIVHLPALKEGDMTRRCPDNSIMLGILDRPLKSIEDGIDLMLNY